MVKEELKNLLTGVAVIGIPVGFILLSVVIDDLVGLQGGTIALSAIVGIIALGFCWCIGSIIRRGI